MSNKTIIMTFRAVSDFVSLFLVLVHFLFIARN